MSAVWALAMLLGGIEPRLLFPAGPPPAAMLDVVDMRGASPDDKLLATTLQGLANGGTEASAYLLLGPWDSFWLDYLRSKQYVKAARGITYPEFVDQQARYVRRLVVYDPEIPATINVATMLASVEGGAALHPNQVGLFASDMPREDLRGRWTTNTQAYRWAFSELWPRMNHRMIACYHPTACAHHLRDYLVARQVFHLWVTGEDKADNVVSSYGEERKFLEEVLAATPPNLPVLGFWYSGADRGMDEYAGVGLAGEYGKLTVACDWGTNLSLLCGIQADLADAVADYRARIDTPPPLLQEDKVYLCLDVVESGDSPSYLQGRQYEVWSDPARGKLPINWSVGPAIFELAPPIAAYYFEHATANDYLYMAISGAAYVHPYRAFMTRVQNPDAAWDAYLSLTRRFMNQMRCTEIGLYTDAWRTYDRAVGVPILNRFIKQVPELEQIILGMGRDEGVEPDRSSYAMGKKPVLVSHVMTRWPEDYAKRTAEANRTWLLEDIQSHLPVERPGFIHVMALSWAFSPTDLVELCARLGPGIVPVRLPDFRRLWREAQRAPSIRKP